MESGGAAIQESMNVIKIFFHKLVMMTWKKENYCINSFIPFAREIGNENYGIYGNYVGSW